ncbi:MAG: hypothetical protein QM813_16740 [Verrucomicrobiota bacterium]
MAIPAFLKFVGLRDVFWGHFVSTPLAGFHFALQWFVRKRIRRLCPLKPLFETLVLNLPIATLMCGIVIGAYRNTAAQPVFERFVATPLPPSAKIIAHGGGQMNFSEGVRIGIWFEIQPGDLNKLIEGGGFHVYEDKFDYKHWKERFWHYARLDIPLTPPYQVFLRESRPKTNTTHVTYIEDTKSTSHDVAAVSYEVSEYLFYPSNSVSVFYLRFAK